MGKPVTDSSVSSLAEFIGKEKLTRGTKISKYLVEKKSKEIFQVVTSEREIAQISTVYCREVVGPL